jgi:acetoin utilization protein AcuB
MSKITPTVSKYMTVLPHTIGFDQDIEKAQKMMDEHHIRHLPVLNGGKLVGIITERDIQLLLSFKNVEAKKCTVEDAYTPDPYQAKADTPLDDVCKEMAAHKYGCTLVTDNNKLVGIFTWVDALNAMNHLMTTRLKH